MRRLMLVLAAPMWMAFAPAPGYKPKPTPKADGPLEIDFAPPKGANPGGGGARGGRMVGGRGRQPLPVAGVARRLAPEGGEMIAGQPTPGELRGLERAAAPPGKKLMVITREGPPPPA